MVSESILSNFFPGSNEREHYSLERCEKSEEDDYSVLFSLYRLILGGCCSIISNRGFSKAIDYDCSSDRVLCLIKDCSSSLMIVSTLIPDFNISGLISFSIVVLLALSVSEGLSCMKLLRFLLNQSSSGLSSERVDTGF